MPRTMFEGQSLAVSISRIRLYHVYMQIVKRNSTFTTGCLQVKNSWIFRENDDNFNLVFVWKDFHEFSKRKWLKRLTLCIYSDGRCREDSQWIEKLICDVTLLLQTSFFLSNHVVVAPLPQNVCFVCLQFGTDVLIGW